MGQDSYLPLGKPGQSVIDRNLPYRFLRGQPLKKPCPCQNLTFLLFATTFIQSYIAVSRSRHLTEFYPHSSKARIICSELTSGNQYTVLSCRLDKTIQHHQMGLSPLPVLMFWLSFYLPDLSLDFHGYLHCSLFAHTL